MKERKTKADEAASESKLAGPRAEAAKIAGAGPHDVQVEIFETAVVDISAAVTQAPFFSSSRRRPTRCYRDWSSDVCSSDLSANYLPDPSARLWSTISCTVSGKPAHAQ